MLKLKTVVALASVMTLASCVHVQPWVRAHERGILADPIMALEGDAASTRYINHVYDARESARGAEGSAGGGCGCN